MSEAHISRVLQGQYPPKREANVVSSLREYTPVETRELVHSMVENTPHNTDKWINENVKALEYKNTTVLMVDHDTVFETHMNDSLKALIHNPKVDGVVVEYFSPELYTNAKAVPLVGSLLAKQIKQPRSSFNINAENLNPNYRRLNFASELAEELARSGKTVSCVDIANKPSYMAIRELWTIVNMIAGEALGKQADKLFPNVFDSKKISFEKIGGYGPLFWRLSNMLFQVTHRGIYDTKQLTILDKVQLHMEDARRLIAASGLKQKIDKESTDGTHKTLLVVYPRAHNMRIKNYMEQMVHGRTEFSTKVKDMAYRLVSSPVLDLKERVYQFSDGSWQKKGEFGIKSLRTA